MTDLRFKVAHSPCTNSIFVLKCMSENENIKLFRLNAYDFKSCRFLVRFDNLSCSKLLVIIFAFATER